MVLQPKPQARPMPPAHNPPTSRPAPQEPCISAPRKPLTPATQPPPPPPTCTWCLGTDHRETDCPHADQEDLGSDSEYDDIISVVTNKLLGTPSSVTTHRIAWSLSRILDFLGFEIPLDPRITKEAESYQANLTTLMQQEEEFEAMITELNEKSQLQVDLTQRKAKAIRDQEELLREATTRPPTSNVATQAPSHPLRKTEGTQTSAPPLMKSDGTQTPAPPLPPANSVSTQTTPPPAGTYAEAVTQTQSPPVKKGKPSANQRPPPPQKGKGKEPPSPPKDKPQSPRPPRRHQQTTKATVVRALPTKYKVGELRRWLHEDNKDIAITGARWLLTDDRRTGKTHSSLVLYLADPTEITPRLRMEGDPSTPPMIGTGRPPPDPKRSR